MTIWIQPSPVWPSRKNETIWVERTGLSNEAFDSLVERVVSRGDDVPASVARLAKACARRKRADAVSRR